MARITDNYGNGLMREIEQYTELLNLAKEKNFEEDVINELESQLFTIKRLLESHTEVTP